MKRQKGKPYLHKTTVFVTESLWEPYQRLTARYGVVVLAIARLMDGLADIVIELRRLNAHHKSPR